MGVVQLIPVATNIATTAAGTYNKQIEGISQISLQFVVDGADAAPKISIWGSNDLTNWDVYEISAGVTEATLPTSGSASYNRDSFPHEYLSVSVDVNGGTTGTIDCKLDDKVLTR